MTGIRARFEALIAELKANPEIEVVEDDLFEPATRDSIARATNKAPGGKLDPFWSAVCAEMNGCRIIWNYKGTKVAPGDRPRWPDRPALGGCIVLNGIEFYGTGINDPVNYPIHGRTKVLAVDDQSYASLCFASDDSSRLCLEETQPNDPLNAIIPTGLTLERFLELTLKTRGVHDWLRLFASGLEKDARGEKAKELIAALFPDVNVDQLGPRSTAPRIYPSLAYLSKKEWFALMREAFAGGDKARCIEICDGALAQHPGESAFPHARGLIQKQELGDTAAAEASFRQALAIDPSYAPSQQALSNLLLDQQRNAESEALMTAWVYQSPDVATLHYDIGVAASRRGNKRQALDALTEGLRLDPTLAEGAPKEYASLRDDPDFKALIAAKSWPSNPSLWYLPTRFTSRPAPLDLAKNFPELKPMPAIRLHPRERGPLPAAASKMGGVFLSNDVQGWPTCEEHGGAPYTAVMQLRATDVPGAPFPKGRDIFQLLWCAHDHESNQYAPRIALRWLQSRELPPPADANPTDAEPDENYVPRECALFPEAILDYPDVWELDHLRERLAADPDMRAIATRIAPDNPDADGATAYHTVLGAADGTKLLGYPDWVQYPEYPPCPECNEPMEHYLTIASREWDGATFHRWKPIEEGLPDTASGGHMEDAGLMIGDAGCLYVFVCRKHPLWPAGQAMQCS